jgi:hypothetical protein
MKLSETVSVGSSVNRGNGSSLALLGASALDLCLKA